MSDHEPHDLSFHDELAHLAAEPLDLPAEAAALHRDLFRRTARVQRGRRVRRRLRSAACLGLLYVLGFQSALLWRPRPAAQVPPVAPPEVPSAPWQHDLESHPGAPERPEDWEQIAQAGSRTQRSERLRRAGDLYLSHRTDVHSALRCYREMMNLLPAGEGEDPEPGDSWLLLALKRDRQQRSGET